MAMTIGDRARAMGRAAGELPARWSVRWHGVAAAAGAAVLAIGVARLVPLVSAVIVAVVGGMAVGSWVPESWRTGLAWSARGLLRAGVVLLGFQVSVGDVLGLGWPMLAAVVTTVMIGLGVTIAAGAALGVPRSTTLLIATGCSICGASAVAAMGGAIRARSEEVALAIALVTLFGTVSIFTVPWLAVVMGLDDVALGEWVGIAVHEVAQVVAASAPAGAAALTVAVVVKLARVILLAPIVAVASVVARREAPTSAPNPGDPSRPPLVPLFVVLFAVAVAGRSLGVVPDVVVDLSPGVTTFLLTAALFALGTGVRLRELLHEGRRALLLGAVSSVVVAGSGLGLLTLTGTLHAQ